MPHLDPLSKGSAFTESFPPEVPLTVPGHLAWHLTSDTWVPKVDLGFSHGSRLNSASSQPGSHGPIRSPSPEQMGWGRARNITVAEGFQALLTTGLSLLLFYDGVGWLVSALPLPVA